jgi:hypothetical protein
MYPSDFRDTSEDVRITLLAALCSSRQAEITDALVDLLVALVHKINARAERRVEKQLTAELKKVRGKEGILFKLATAAVDKPDEVVRRALFPVVGEKTLRELVAEAKANEKVFKAKVRTTLRSSYSSYYRQMLPPLLNTLGFKCNNTAYRPVTDAMELLKKYADVDGKTRFYDAGDDVPMDAVVRKDWREAVVDDKGKVERIPYELCVLVALRDAVRRREIYVEGAARWRNPENDLPGDFEATRAVHYAAIRQPLNPRAFIHRRQPADRRDETGERHLRSPRHRLVGPRYGVRVGLEEVRVLVLELHDRVLRPLRRQRRDDLLARGAEERLHLLPAQVLFVARGRGDDRGAAAALHGRRD